MVRHNSWFVGLLSLGVLPVLVGCQNWQNQPPAAQEITPTPQQRVVVARGKIIPQWDLIKLSVPNAQDSQVSRILVKEGEQVKPKQMIAVLQGSERRRADLKAARTNVILRQAQLKKARQGDAKPGELAAQQAVVARLQRQLPVEQKRRQADTYSAQATLQEAALNLQRRQQLLTQGAISQAEVDAARQDFETARAAVAAQQAQLEEAITRLSTQIIEQQARLAELQQIRPVDIEIAEAELQQALVQVEQSRADFENTLVRAPVAGQIIRINTKVGEQVNTQLGIVELGRTHQMYVNAEVYESDLPKIRPGQLATITSEYGGFTGELMGKVESIGLQVGQPTLSRGGNNPTNDDNARVVTISIRLAPRDSLKVSGFINMQVRAKISLSSH